MTQWVTTEQCRDMRFDRPSRGPKCMACLQSPVKLNSVSEQHVSHELGFPLGERRLVSEEQFLAVTALQQPSSTPNIPQSGRDGIASDLSAYKSPVSLHTLLEASRHPT